VSLRARVIVFLRERVRELVGVAVLSAIMGSVIVKILHCGEGGDVKQVARTSKQISRICDCPFLSL